MAEPKLSYAERMRTDGMFPAVLRFAQLSPKDVAAMIAHAERRIGDLSHIDFSRTHLNQILVGADPDDPSRTNVAREVAAEAEEMAEFNLASNIVGLSRMGRKKDLARARRRGRRPPWVENARSGPPLREGVLTLHRDWFRAADDCPPEHILEFLDDEGERARWDKRKCERFMSTGVAFLRDEFGPSLRYCRADFDEQSVHLQFLLVDRVKESPSHRYAHGRHLYRLTQHRCIGGVGDGRTGYEVAQDTVAEWFQQPEYRDMRIVRGESRAAKKRVAQAEVEKLKQQAEAAAMFGEAPDLPAGSPNAQAAYLLKQRVAGAGKMRKDDKQKAALEFLEAAGVVTADQRHEASTRRARQSLIDKHVEVAGTAEDIVADPDRAAARIAAKAAADQKRADEAAAAERARLDREAEARRRAEEEEHRRRLAEERAEVAAREQEVERKAGMLNTMLREFIALSEHVKAAARHVGLVDHPLVQTAARAAERMRDMVGRLGGWERTR